MEAKHQCTPAELGQVMDKYGTMVYRLAFSQLRNGTDADDIYQEVFLKYAQWKRYIGKAISVKKP